MRHPAPGVDRPTHGCPCRRVSRRRWLRRKRKPVHLCADRGRRAGDVGDNDERRLRRGKTRSAGCDCRWRAAIRKLWNGAGHSAERRRPTCLSRSLHPAGRQQHERRPLDHQRVRATNRRKKLESQPGRRCLNRHSRHDPVGHSSANDRGGATRNDVDRSPLWWSAEGARWIARDVRARLDGPQE